MSAKVAEIFETMDYGPAPESDKTASQWLEQHGRSFGHFINGAFVKPAKGKSFATKNPATGEMLAKIACGGKAEVSFKSADHSALRLSSSPVDSTRACCGSMVVVTPAFVDPAPTS